jgi:hypothetical protein
VISRRVPLPPGVSEPFTVYVNGVAQTRGQDFEVRDGALVFADPLVQEGGPTKRGWFLGFWGVGTYRRNDEVDVSYTHGGRPQVAHALPLAPE